MDFSRVLFEFLGIQWTLLTIVTGIIGAIPTLGAGYKLYDRWIHREERRLAMLRYYLDKEEKNISAKRKRVLDSIRIAGQSYLTEREFDVGHEIDQTIVLLDSGNPELAAAKLTMLENRLASSEALLTKRADDLARHRASVHIFIAALADKSKNTMLGLAHIAKALDYEGTDVDALKYQSILLLANGDLDQAERSFNKLRQSSTGPQNAGYRADAYLGLATIELRREPPRRDQALSYLATALNNLNSLRPLEQDKYALGQIHKLQAEIYADRTWRDSDTSRAIDYYSNALIALEQISHKRGTLEFEIDAIRAAQKKLLSDQYVARSNQMNA